MPLKAWTYAPSTWLPRNRSSVNFAAAPALLRAVPTRALATAVFDTAEDSARFPNSHPVSIDEIDARASDATSGLKERSRPHEKSISMRAWYKTKEGPVEATARMRDVVADIAALRPGNARVLHAEVTARPGCTLLSVDVGALIDGRRATAEAMATTTTNRSNATDEEMARALLDAGVRNSLDGVLDWITNGAPSEVRRRTFRRFAFDSRTARRLRWRSTPSFTLRFARFVPFGAESVARGDDEEGSIDSVEKDIAVACPIGTMS